jgi:putative transposase
MRREAGVKTEVLQLVARSPLPVRQTLKELKVSSATYYRWRRRYAERGMEGLQDLLPRARRVWNRLRDEERGFIVAYALEHPSLSPREVAARLVDRRGGSCPSPRCTES